MWATRILVVFELPFSYLSAAEGWNASRMGNLVDTCQFFAEKRAVTDSNIAIFVSYSALMFLSLICACIAIHQIYFLPSQPVWPHHKTFLKLVLAGSFIGIVASYFRSQQLVFGIASQRDESFSDDALADWNGAFHYLLSPWETTCLTL